MKTPVLGIDFGTTNTVAAWLDEMGELRVINMGDDNAAMPTMVSYMPNDAVLVGSSAKGRLIDAPTETVYGAKRFLGRRFLSEFVGRHKDTFSYEICAADNGLCAAFVQGKVRPLEDVAFAVLERVVELSNIAADVPFEECVLSVPAHFSYRQRSLLRQAAERLLNVKAMINEPTAAALSYAMHAPEDAMLLVFDLGGGTFDVTVLRIHNNTVGVLATGGDAFLGGIDIDNAIARLLAQRLAEKSGVEVMGDPVVALRISQAAEKAKIELSSAQQAHVHLPIVYTDGERFIDMKETLTRADIEMVATPFVERAVGLCRDIGARAGMNTGTLHGVVLVGGQTRMPMIQRRLHEVFQGVAFPDTIDPIRSVAEGAALLGAGATRLVDVLPLPIGVMAPGLSAGTALERNVRLPAKSEISLPSRPGAGQPLKIALYESVDVTSIDREMIGVLEVPAPWLDENNGALTLHTEMSSGFELKAEIEAATGGRLPLHLYGPGQPPRDIDEDQIESVESEEEQAERLRGSPRTHVQISVHMRRNETAEFIDAVATDVSKEGLFIETSVPFVVGTELELEIDAGGWAAARVEVIRVIDVATKAQTGRRRGLGVRFLQIDPKARAHLDQLMATETELSFDVDIVEDAPPPSVAERMRRFLKAVAAQRLYAAIDIADPLAPAEDVERAVREVQDLVNSAMLAATPAVRERLGRAQDVCFKLKRLFLDPRARLRYDFRCGYIRAEERLRLAAKGGPSVATLREAWHHAFPDRVDRAALHQARAMQAAHSSSWALAAMEAEKAIELEPFSMTLRLAKKEWVVKATASRRG